MPPEHPQIHPSFRWSDIDTILLDMDGTLLDSYFDDFFWEEYVPKVFAEAYGLSAAEARKRLLAKYQQVECTLQWADLDYWSDQLGLDIPELKCKIDHLIQVHPYVVDFLRYINGINKEIHLVTNAHTKTLEIKLRKTAIGPYFTRIIPAEEVGEAKEVPVFWEKLATMLKYDKARTLLVDDNTKVLASAQAYGLGHLVYVAKPSSRRPVSFSPEHPSIVFFQELIF